MILSYLIVGIFAIEFFGDPHFSDALESAEYIFTISMENAKQNIL